MGFSVIPGNIKQQYLPFVLNNNAGLNMDRGYAVDPQYFTFRSNSKYMCSGKGTLNFCPSTFKKHIDDDISYKMLYDKIGNNNSLTFDTIMDNIPGVQIREFLPDTALDQAINFFVTLIKEVTSMFGDDGIATGAKTKKKVDGKEVELSKQEKAAEQDSFFKKLTNVAWFVINYVTGIGGSPSIVTAICDGKNGLDTGIKDKRAKYILDFPYLLYYRLQSCTTTSLYEVPALNAGKQLYSSDGAPGWSTADSGFRFLPKSISSLPIIGGLLGKMFGNIGISWMPWWDATSGNATLEPPVELTFDLYNDTAEAALMNFIFVNTIVPNNKWIQYGLFQHSSHLYDVKLEGYNRLFACTGKFNVTYNGMLRTPPDSWFDMLSKYVNNTYGESFIDKCKSERSIKIPDIYTVKMTFDSLLPSNFNQYLYTLVANKNQIDQYYYHTYDESKMASSLTNAVKGVIKGAVNAWNGKNYIPKDQVS